MGNEVTAPVGYSTLRVYQPLAEIVGKIAALKGLSIADVMEQHRAYFESELHDALKATQAELKRPRT